MKLSFGLKYWVEISISKLWKVVDRPEIRSKLEFLDEIRPKVEDLLEILLKLSMLGDLFEVRPKLVELPEIQTKVGDRP